MMGYVKRAPARYREALELYRALKDPAGAAESFSGEGLAHEQAVRLSRLVNDPRLVGRALLNHASDVYWARRYPEHKVLVEEAADVFRAINDRRGLAVAIRGIGLALQEKSPSEALPLFREMLSLARSVNDLHIEALAHGSIAWASTYLGKPQDVIDAYSKGVETARSGRCHTDRSVADEFTRAGLRTGRAPHASADLPGAGAAARA